MYLRFNNTFTFALSMFGSWVAIMITMVIIPYSLSVAAHAIILAVLGVSSPTAAMLISMVLTLSIMYTLATSIILKYDLDERYILLQLKK